MSKFIYTLMISGYYHKFRYKLLKGILNRQLEIDRDVKSGNQKLFRSKKEILIQKLQTFGKHPNTFFVWQNPKYTKVPSYTWKLFGQSPEGSHWGGVGGRRGEH